MTDGKKANKNGQILEEMIEPSLKKAKFTILSHDKWEALQMKVEKGKATMPDRIAIRSMPYTTIYNSKGKTEFVLISYTGAINTTSFPNANAQIPFTCRVECKRQEVSGSVDEKFPYLVINAEEAYPEDNVIIVSEIDGARPGAQDWLQNAIDSRRFQVNKNKTIVHHSLVEFITWAGRAFPYIYPYLTNGVAINRKFENINKRRKK